ncbi:hypothetical protein WJX82_010930, partial [Trebouxia sp. C0006]
WLSVREELWRIEDFLNKWSKGTDGQLSGDPVAIILAKEIDSYKRCLPYLKFVRGTGWERKHWTQLFIMLKLVTKGPDAVTFDNLTLAHFLDKADRLAGCAEDINALNAQALGESVIRKALEELQVWGLERRFTLYSYSSTAGTKSCPLIKEWREVMTEVGDHQSLVASLKQAAYFHLFKDEAGAWERRLAVLSEGLQTLNAIQRKWVYLEPIFARGALPNEQPRFRRIDDQLRQLMSGTEADPMVVHFADIPRIMESLQQMLQQMETCQKALSNFLEDKRSAFPRFYFIGDDDLLEILGQARDPVVIQAHLKKLFPGVHSVALTDSKDAITAAMSIESESVQLAAAVTVSEQVESWLQSLLTGMQATLQGLLTSCMQHTDFKSMPSQVLCLAAAIKFTQQAEQAIEAGKLSSLQAELKQQLAEYTAADWEGYRVMQLKIQALVLDLIHHIDVVEALLSEGVSLSDDWVWVKQLRYYSTGRTGATALMVKMADAALDYSWEYQGNAPKLVYTPLTDRCYLTLTQGITLGYGGNPYGPAGTGKTESVKALGQALARQVLVFNCDGEFDFKSVGRIFMGLVKCGAWGCFDEFNRLEEDVLSAVSQQIQLIQGAIKARQPSVELMGRSIEVNCNAGIFVTMNPAGKGYGGRSKLPDNLKALFRSVAMTLPDNEIIAEVLLLSNGFAAAKELGRKLVALFGLAQQLLSRQQHYDWGLRALKICLAIAGRLLREHRSAGQAVNQVAETQIIVKGVCLATMPKLTFEDTARFQALLQDIFSGVSMPETADDQMLAAIHNAAASLHLQVVPEQVEKVLQLHLACLQRIGVIIVGPSGSGKSTIWRLLQAALTSLGRPPMLHALNPKAISRHHLLGHIDADTREWTDGVLTAAARAVAKEPLEQRSWVVCDGDVDPEWIESLNSVLDDNRLLTMPSGERIQFANNVNFIFECHSLQYASPATVSRCGMLLMSDQHNDIDNMLAAWLSTQPQDQAGQLQQWLQRAFKPALQLVQTHGLAVDTPLVAVIRNALSHLTHAGTKHDFACGLFRGLGANLDEVGRQELAAEISKLMGEPNVLLGASQGDTTALLRGVEGPSSFLDAPDPQPSGQLIMTEGVSNVILGLVPWLRTGAPLLLVGPEGCGKATLLQHCLDQLAGTAVATVSCSAQTAAANMIQKLEQMCGTPVSTNTGRVLRPRDSGKLVLYLRDINLPKADKYGTSQVMAFLQQLLTYQGFYDSKLEFVGLERIQIVGSMNPATTVGRQPLTPRFAALMHVAYMGYPSPAHLQSVLSTMLANNLNKVVGLDPSWNGQGTADKLAACLLEVYTALQSAFSPSQHPHYIFTPRHLSLWASGLQNYSLHATDLLQAAAYEACRVFRDRLASSEHIARFDSIMADTLRKHWRINLDLTGSVFATLGGPAAQLTAGKGSAGAMQVLLNHWSSSDYLQLVTEKVTAFEREQRELSVVPFGQALERLAQLDRVVSKPGGAALICGQAGVGRKSALALVAYMHHMEVFSPSMPTGYSLQSFRSDLKALMLKTGVEGQPVCLFLEDHQMVDPGFLECINSLLSGGEVHGLFTNEELDSTLAPLKEVVASQALLGQTLFSFFTAQVQRNLRIVISMDPSSPDFQHRCQANPALFSRCNIQWMEGWDADGMQAVAIARLQPILNDAEKDASKLVQQAVVLHSSCLSTGATPRHYVAFVSLCSSIYTKKRSQLLQQQNFLKGGLSKLAGAAATVDTLSKEAQQQRVQLKASQVQAEQALQNITAAMEQASGHRQEAASLKKQLADDQVSINGRKGDVESELAVVAPIIEAARLAVGQIKSDHLNEIRSLKAPPDAIRDVLEGVLKLMGQADTSWNSMKKFLGNRGIKNEIIEYDAHRITPEMRTAVNRLLAQKGASFEQATIFRVSQAAAPLAAWVTANLQYADVLQKVAPLEQELGGLTANYTQSQERIAGCEAQLQQLDEQVVSLKGEFESKKGLEIELKNSLAKAEATLTAASALLGKLSGEKSRWEAQVAEFTQVLQQLPTGALLAAAFITYLGKEPEDVRQAKLTQWVSDLKMGSPWSLTKFLASETEQLTWKTQGLAHDALSAENAVIILQSWRPPLILDPFVTTLELAVRFGKTLVVEEADSIEPLMYPLLTGDMQGQGSSSSVKIGDRIVDYNKDFRLMLVTRNSRPQLAVDAAALLCLVNFTVTRSGLEGLLLGLALQAEQPQLESQRTALLQQEEEQRLQLAALDTQVLQSLATSKGSLLDNQELLESLNQAKAKAATINASLQESRNVQNSLSEQREVYRPLAARGASIFFAMRDLQTMNTMYHFSLAVFLALFSKALQSSTSSGNLSSHLTALSTALTQLVMDHVSQALFNSDRLAFGMHLAYNLVPHLFQAVEWDLFLSNAVGTAQGGRPAWVAEEMSAAWAALATHCGPLLADCNINEAQLWGPWANSPAPEATFPAGPAAKLNAFQRLLLMQAVRPDRLEAAMSSFVCSALGLGSIAPPPLSIATILRQEVTAGVPLLFMTNLGADPSQELQEVANSIVGAAAYHQLAMGQGQTQPALDLLQSCAQSGEWLCLKNVHLVVAWLLVLEKALRGLTPHPSFRLLLTSEPHPDFPPALLEACLKVSFEAPPGVKRNLQRTFEAWGPAFISRAAPLQAQLLFMLAWFHAIVQERRTYMPQASPFSHIPWNCSMLSSLQPAISGWASFYDFNFSDLRSGADVVLANSEGRQPHWKKLRGLLENAIYGGRVDNLHDFQILRAYLEQFICEEAVTSEGCGARPLPGTRLTIPSSSNPLDYSTLIESLPESDSPALFGLPANINRAAGRAASAAVVAQLKLVTTSQESALGYERMRWAAQLGPLLRLWESLLPSLPNFAQLALPITASSSPLDAFLVSEAGFAQQLITAVSTSLTSLSDVVLGSTVLTPQVQELGRVLLTNQVPSVWSEVWSGPEQPLAYCAAAAQKATSLGSCVAASAAGRLWSAQLNLGHLFNPGRLLNALRQECVHQLKVPMDNLRLVTVWDRSRLQGLPYLTLSNIMLQGAAFEGSRLRPLTSESPTNNPMPAVLLAWMPKQQQGTTEPSIQIPLYIDPQRSSTIAHLQLPVADTHAKQQYTLAGLGACVLT